VTILVQNFYFASVQRAPQVLANRCEADERRVLLGLPRGRTFALLDGSPGAPKVVWQQEFADQAAWRRDLDGLAASPEFGNIRARQTEILASFARAGYELVAQ
jgi:hypothetical protein